MHSSILTLALTACLGGFFIGLLSYLKRQSGVPSIPDDWDELPSDRATQVWLSCAHFLRQNGIIIFGHHNYFSVPGPPHPPPSSPFDPSDKEDFVHRVERSPRRVRHFVLQTPVTCIGLDNLGRNVFIKAVRASSTEWSIIKALSTSPRNSWNRTIPCVSIIHAKKWVFIVQAAWGTMWDHPQWDSVSTRLRMARQLIEGLCFMHTEGVAHGDLHPGNIVCNHEDIHPAHTRWPSGKPQPAFQSTFDYQLAFIDFEFAVRFTAQNHIREFEQGPPDAFRPPECSDDAKYDVLAADIYSLGQVLKHELAIDSKTLPPIDTRAVAPDYIALLDSMTAEEPRDRPTAARALELVLAASESLQLGSVSGMP
ncbi:kinase-like domain-containing protein [Mycena galericulata]|nr:kinase-like domain-containing protein [Mycena galericulata]